MADTVLNTTVFDGAKKLITHYNVVSDGTGAVSYTHLRAHET